ncbi:hypothetical protein LZ32DRAFT_461472 [Colletotrichum eremochloae]|nr:hypothetical protein LZ32DRAFT_461472 [Colletotrichum eremochloae]
MKRTRAYQARLQLPWWLSNKVWDLQVHSACQGWKFSILPWITRPQDAPIFHLVKRGSWADVLDAFNQNQASLRDRDSDGNTLLHWAASYGNLDVFINLIKLGLSTEETTAQGSSALQLLWLMERSTEEAVNVIKLLTLNGSLDEYLLYLFPRTGKFTANALTSRENSIRLKLSTLVWYFPGVLQIMASELQIDPLQLPPDARFTSLNWRCADPDIFLDEVGRGEAWDAASFRAILCGPDNNNLHTFARAYFYGVQALAFENCLFCTSFRKESKIESWRELARRIFSAASLEALIQCRSVSVNPRGTLSPFFDGLFSLNLHFQEFDVTNREWRRRISRAMVMWLEDVRSSGIDLDEYGAAIRKLYLDNAWLQTERWGSKWVGNVKYKESGPRLVGLTIGPMPEDWKLHWDMDEDEFAGEFWELVENPPLRIPGGWVDE